MLLRLLLLAEHSQLEKLQPALITEALGAELDHLTVYRVVVGYVIAQSGVPFLDNGERLQILVDLLTYLEIGELESLKSRLEIVPIAKDMTRIPDTPGLFISFLHEVVKIFVRLIAQKF